jgi:ABC-2 type transport system permease protein
MKVLYVILYNMKRELRHKTSLMYMLLLPIILILILGNALKVEYTPSDIKEAQVYYCSEDNGEISKEFEDYIKSDEFKDLIDVKKVNSKEEGLKLIKTDERSSLIYLDGKFTDNIRKGKDGYVNIYNERDNIQAKIVKNIVEGFCDVGNAVYASYLIGGEGEYLGEYLYEGNSVIDSPIDIDGKVPRAIDYYAVTMLVMILMYGANYGSNSIISAYVENEGIRLQTTPTRRIQILIGNIASSVLIVFIEGLLLMMFAKFVYKANYGHNIYIIIVIIFSMAVFSNFMGMMIGTLIKNQERASSIIGIFVVACTFISGGYMKFIINNPIYQKIIQFIPNGMAQNAMFNVIYNSNQAAVKNNILAIWVGIVICMSVSIVASKRGYVK